jgi:hypothetical protein
VFKEDVAIAFKNLVQNDPRSAPQVVAIQLDQVESAASGNRVVKSLPWRVINRIPALSRRAMMRMPSCLISCSQPGPLGGALAGDGRHGSINPSPGRITRNDMTA